MTVVDSAMQDLDSIEDEDILRRMLLQTDDFAEKKRIRTRISKLKEKRLKEFYASDDVTGSHTEITMFSGSQATFSAIRHESEATTCADTGIRFADSRKRSSQEHLEEIQVDEKMRKCEEIIDARIRKKSQERGKRLQQIKSEMEKSENISISQASHATQLAVTTDRRGKNVTEPVVNGTARNSSTRDRSADRIEVLTKPRTNIIQDTKSLGITGEKEFEATERTVESRKVFKCSPDSSLDRDSIEPPIRATKFSPFDAANVRKVSMEAVENSILDSMEVIENVPEPVKVQPLMPSDALSSKSKPERKVSSPRKEEPELKSSRSEARKVSREMVEKKERPRQESLKLDLDGEPVIEDVSDATTPYLLARKQSSDYSVMSPEPVPLESRRLSEVEIEDVTDSTIGEDELDDADVVVQTGNKKLSTIEETPRKSSLKNTTRFSDSPRKVSVPSASSERAGSPSRRCCRRGTTPEATPLTPAEKREQLIARKISVTDEEFERMEKEILEEETQETSNSPRKTKSPEKSDVEPKRVRKISPTENKARSSLPSITGSLKPARRVDSKENALKSVQKPAEKLRAPAKQPESQSYTKKPSDERLKVSPIKSPTKSRLPAAQTKSPARSARGQYSPKSSKELTLTAKRELTDEESTSNDPVAKNNPDLNDAKKTVQAAPEISMPSLVKSTPADTPRSVLSPIGSRESTPKADDSSRKAKPERRNSKDEKNKKEYKRQDSGKVNGDRRNFDVIEDVDLLERLLESAKEYDERSRIRARLRILKKPLSGIPTRNTSSPRASPLLGRRAMPTVEKKTLTPSPMRKLETPKKTEPSRPKKEDKPLPDEVSFEFKIAGNIPFSESRPVMDHPYENLPEQPVEDSVMRRSPSPVVQSVRRISEIRRSVSPAPLERGPSFRRSPSPVITSGSVIYRPQQPVDPTVPEPEIKSSPPAERRKSAIKLALNAESTTIINDPVTNIKTVLNATVSEAPPPNLEAVAPELAQTPSEKPNKFGRSLTSQLSFPNLRLSEDDPSLPQGPDETRVITSSYGVGPTDDAGKPLFGLGALRKARNKTPESEAAPETLDAAEKTKRDQGPVDSAGRPLFGLGALRAPRTPDEPNYNQTSKSVLDIIKSHEREGPVADRPDVIPERPRARKRDSYILEDEQAIEVKEPIMERSPNLKGIIQQHEDVSMRPIEFKVDLNRAGGPAVLIGRSQPLQEVISRHEQAIIEDAKIAAITTSKIELDKSLPISEAIRKHEQAIVEDKVISTSKISVEVEKSLPVKEALNLHKSAIEMDGKTVIPKRTVDVEKTQSIRDIIDIHKQKQEDETGIDNKDVVSSPRPRRKLRDTFLDAAPANPAAATTPVKRPGILKKPKESQTPLSEPVVEPSSQPDPYANLERVEICNRNSPAEKRVSIDNTVLVNGLSNSNIPEDAAPWRRRSVNSSPSRADQVEPSNVVTSSFELTSEESQTFELPSWRTRREPDSDRKSEPERKPSRDRREQIEPVSVPDWRRRTVPEEPVSKASEPSWRSVPEAEPVAKASDPAWRKSVQPEEPVKTRLSRVEAAPESSPSWRSRAASRTEVEKPVFETKLPEQPVSENEPAWRKQSAERQPVYEELKRATVEPTVTVRTGYAPPPTVESRVTSTSRYSREETRKYSTGLEQRPEHLRNLTASPELRNVTIEPAVTLRTAVTPSLNVESAVTSSSRYSRDEARKYSTGFEQQPEHLRSVVPNSQEFSRDSSPSSNPLTPAELRQASVAKTEHRNSVTERWQPKTQPITNAYAVSLERTSRQNTPSRQTTPERTTDNTFASKYTAPRMAVSSVKGLAQKFMQTVEDTGSPPKVNKSYPKAGLIFRSSSFKNSQGLTPPEQEGSSLRRTGSLRSEGSPSWRRASKENADPNYDASPPWRRKSIIDPDEDAPITRDFSSPTPKSFLDDRSKVTGVSDILDRMRAGNTVVGEDGPKTDEEAKSLLNKFLGAQIIMQGIEPMLQPSNGLSQARGHLQDSLSSSQIVREQQRQQQQWNSLDTKPKRMGESVVINGIDILTCDDDFKLNELLDTCNDYDTRQKIKARIRDLLAAQRQGATIESNGNPVATITRHSTFESANQDLATPDGESLLPQLVINQLCTSLSQGALTVEDGSAASGRCLKENMFDSGTESGDDLRRKSQESLQQFMEGIKTSLEKAGRQDENLIGQVQIALTKLKTTLQGGGRHSMQEMELVGLITRLQSTLDSVQDESLASPSRILVEKSGVRGRFAHFPELKPVIPQEQSRSISDEHTRQPKTSDSDKENKLSPPFQPPDIEKGKSVPWKVRLARRKTERSHTVNISPCNALDLRQCIRAAARNKTKEDIERATGGQLKPCFDFQFGKVGLLEAQASLDQDKTKPSYIVKQKSIGDLYTSKPRPYGAQKHESVSEDSDDGIVFYGLQKSSKSYGDVQSYLRRSTGYQRSFEESVAAVNQESGCQKGNYENSTNLPASSITQPSRQDSNNFSRDGSIELVEAEDEPEEVVEVATLTFNVRDNDVRLDKRPERPGTLSLVSNNNTPREVRQKLPSASTSTDTEDERNAVTAQLTIRGPLIRQEAVEASLGDPSKGLFTENEAIHIAIHKAAINKQLSQEYRRRSSNRTPEEEEVLTGSLQLTRQESVTSNIKHGGMRNQDSIEKLGVLRQDSDSSSVTKAPIASTSSTLQKQGSSSSLTKSLSGSRIFPRQSSAQSQEPSVSHSSSRDNLIQRDSSSSSVFEEPSSGGILRKQGSNSSMKDQAYSTPLQRQSSASSVGSSASRLERTPSLDIPAVIKASKSPSHPALYEGDSGKHDQAEISVKKPIPIVVEPEPLFRQKAFETGLQKSKSSGSICHKPKTLDLEDSDDNEEPEKVVFQASQKAVTAPAQGDPVQQPPVEEEGDSAARLLQKQFPWNQVPRESANDGEISENKPAEKISAKERKSRYDKYKRRDSVKQQARRANTINIPKAYVQENVSPQRAPAPAFVPKTDNDRKFLAFICQNSTVPTVTPPTFTRAGGGNGIGGIWGSRFSNLKTTFETKASQSASVSPEPPKNRPRPEPKIDGLFVAQNVYDTSHQLGRGKYISAPTTPVVQQRVEGFARQNSGNSDARNRYSVYSVNRVSVKTSNVLGVNSDDKILKDRAGLEQEAIKLDTFETKKDIVEDPLELNEKQSLVQAASETNNTARLESVINLSSVAPSIPSEIVPVIPKEVSQAPPIEPVFQRGIAGEKEGTRDFISQSGNTDKNLRHVEEFLKDRIKVGESCVIVPELTELETKIPAKSKQSLKVSDGEQSVARAFVNVGTTEQVPNAAGESTKNIPGLLPKTGMPGESRSAGKPLITEHRKDAKPPLFMSSPTVAITPPWVKDIGRVDGVMPARSDTILSPPAQKKFFEKQIPPSSINRSAVQPSLTSRQVTERVDPPRSTEPAEMKNRVQSNDKDDVLALVRDLEANSMLIQGLIMSEKQVREAVARDHVENSDRFKQVKAGQIGRSQSSSIGISKSSSESSVKKVLDQAMFPLIQASPKPFRKAEEPKPHPQVILREKEVRQEPAKPPIKPIASYSVRQPAAEPVRNHQEKSPITSIRQSPQRNRRPRPQSVRVTSVESNGVTRTRYTLDKDDHFDASSEDSSDDDSSSGVPKRYCQPNIQSPTGLESITNIVHRYNEGPEPVRNAAIGSAPLVRTGSQSSYQSDTGSQHYLPQRMLSSPTVAPQKPQRAPSVSEVRPQSQMQSEVAPPLPPKPAHLQASPKTEIQYNKKRDEPLRKSSQLPAAFEPHSDQQVRPISRQPQPLTQTQFSRQPSFVSVRSQSSAPTSNPQPQPSGYNPGVIRPLPLKIPKEKLPSDIISPPVLSFAYNASQAPRVEVPEFLESETLTGLRPGLGFNQESVRSTTGFKREFVSLAARKSEVSRAEHQTDLRTVRSHNTQLVSQSTPGVQKPVPPPRRLVEEPKPMPRTVFNLTSAPKEQKPSQARQPQQHVPKAQQPVFNPLVPQQQTPRPQEQLQIPRSNSGSRVAAMSSAIDGGLFKQQDSLSNRSPSPRRPQSLYAGDGPVVAAGKTSPRSSLGLSALKSLPKQFEACISPESAERKQEELIRFFFETPNLLSNTQQSPTAVRKTTAPKPSVTQRSASGTNLAISPSQKRILSQTANKGQLRQRTFSDGRVSLTEPSDLDMSDIASDIDAVFDDLMKKEQLNGHLQGQKDLVKMWLSQNFPSEANLTNNGSVTGLQKSVTASQSTNATVVQQQNQGFVRSSVTSSSFRTQSQSSTVTVNPGGSAFSKFQQLDRANSSSSPRTPLSATTGTAFSFSAPSTKSGVFTVKDAILQWCQGRTRGYKNVQVTDFSTSWTDGLAFCALIHHFYPDAFDFDSLDPKNRRYNLDLAFRTADEKAGIAPLLDVEDMISMRKPDWKCVFTYIQTFYRRLKDQ